MTTPAERIRAMVSDGRVDEEEGKRLLSALADADGAGAASAKGASGARLFVDPFVRWGGGGAALAGFAFALAGVAISQLGVHFDGFLDLHVGNAAPSTALAIGEQLVAVPLGAAVFWLIARLLGGSGRRFVDFLGAVGVAHAPAVIFAVPLSALVPVSSDMTRMTRMSPALLVIIVVALVCIAWQIALLFFGYRNASGLRGPRLGLSFVGAILVAEIVSKVVLSFAMR